MTIRTVAVLLSGVFMGVVSCAVQAQSLVPVDSQAYEQTLTYDTFIRDVLARNVDYKGQHDVLVMANADRRAAAVRPNPTMSLGADRDLTLHNRFAKDEKGNRVRQAMAESKSIGITQTIELGGKRKWRKRSAEQTFEAAVLTYADFKRTLILDASSAFVDALAAQRTVAQLRIAAAFLADLTRAQEERYAAGQISQVELTQTRLEEVQFRNDLLKAQDAADAAHLALTTFLGPESERVAFVVQGELEQAVREDTLPTLIQASLAHRPDLVALRQSLAAANSAVRLSSANRIPSVDLGLTYNAVNASSNLEAPSPTYRQLQVSMGVPLMLFDHGQYDLQHAKAAASKAQHDLESAELHAVSDVRTAYSAYRSALARIRTFHAELLQSADSVLVARRYAYQRGKSSLLELLDAQRSANDIQQAYYDALADVARARIALQRASGVGELHF